MKSLRQLLNSPISLALTLFLLGRSVDILSSSLHLPEGYIESNPFGRYADGSFYLGHALIHDAIWLLETLIECAGIWLVGKAARLNKEWLLALVCAPPLWYASESLEAALHNLMIYFHLHQPLMMPF